MSITTELENYRIFLTDAYDKCQSKGAIMPEYRNLQNLTACIASLLDRPQYEMLTTETGDTLTTETGIDLEVEAILYLAENGGFIVTQDNNNWEVE